LHGWQANQKRTCAQPVLLGLCPKLKYPPLCGGIFIDGLICSRKIKQSVGADACFDRVIPYRSLAFAALPRIPTAGSSISCIKYYNLYRSRQFAGICDRIKIQ